MAHDHDAHGHVIAVRDRGTPFAYWRLTDVDNAGRFREEVFGNDAVTERSYELWSKLTADGGAESQCGWLKDKFDLSWQIVPSALPRLLQHLEPAKAARAMQAMMQMKKIYIARLEEAAR
ncbi:VOC family protein [Sorangium sp. So ce429]